MRYVIRSVKYFLFLLILLAGLVWLMTLVDTNITVDAWEYAKLKFGSKDGIMMLVALVVLAAAYPLFGYMRKRMDSCDMEADKVRINNAMSLYGFRYKGCKDGVHIYRSSSILRRLMLRFDDTIELRQVGDGVEFYGLRSQVARVTYQLQGYLNNRRYDNI
ncbi:MAG: hypothetical protein IKB15_05270 [Alistipes sp.]|nr:hypothetical protein [Alistipes sp.]